MNAIHYDPADRFTLTSLLLGTIGLLLFILPILSVPLASVGFAFGAVGLGVALVLGPRNWSRLRWPLGALTVSAVTILVGVMIGYAPIAEPTESRTETGAMLMDWQPLTPRGYIPPPRLPM